MREIYTPFDSSKETRGLSVRRWALGNPLLSVSHGGENMSIRHILAILSVLSLAVPAAYSPGGGSILAAPQHGAKANDNPCDHLPDPPGKAKGIHKKCPSISSSSGIVKADFNGDGFADLAIGVPNQTVNGVANAGAVNVIYGSANGLTTATAGVPVPQTWTSSNLGLSGPAAIANSNFGIAVAGGDFNGDGKSDLAIAIRRDESPTGFDGAIVGISDIVVIFGSANGLTGPVQFFDDQCPPGDLANGLAWGDVNGDGAGDLLLACSGSNPSVLQFTGQKGVGLNEFQARFVFEGDFATGSTGLANGSEVVLAAGDFNGDGRSDLAIGVPDTDLVDETSLLCLIGCPVLNSEIGAVAVLYGSSAGLNITAQWWRQGVSGICCHPGTGAHFGAALAAGDFNLDHRQDLAVGLPGGSAGGLTGAGAVVIINGSISGLSAGTQIWNEGSVGGGVQSNNAFGSALAANDFNGDGYADLAIGIPNESHSGYINAGQVDVVYGSSSGLSTAGHAAQFIHQGGGIGGSPTSGGHYGSALSAWNFGRNEFAGGLGTLTIIVTADLAIAAPNATVSGVSNAGEVNVLYGSHFNNGLTSNQNQLFTQGSLGLPLSADRLGFTMY
jgi:hypothetical protein